MTLLSTQYLIDSPMGFVRPILVVLLAVALAAYGFDCLAMTTPEQAMQCCNSMPCSPQGHHNQDCCKTMATLQAPFVQTQSGHGISLAQVSVASARVATDTASTDVSISNLAADGNAPPLLYSPPLLALRI